jgi:hypothetical protein
MLRPTCICHFFLIYSNMDLVNLILNSCLVSLLWNKRAALHCTIHASLEKYVTLYKLWSVYLPNGHREINTVSSYLYLIYWTSLLVPQTIFSRLILPSRCSFGLSSPSFPTVAAGGSLLYVKGLSYLPACLQYTWCAKSQCNPEFFVFQVYSGKEDRPVMIPLYIQNNTITQNIKTIHVARGTKPVILLFST